MTEPRRVPARRVSTDLNGSEWNRWRGEVTADLRAIKGDMDGIQEDLKRLTSNVGQSINAITANGAASKAAATAQTTFQDEERLSSHWRTSLIVIVVFSSIAAIGTIISVINFLRLS